ncbi:MAG: hypothetical protein R3C05_31825, partial [Pirellulaceae bacterium]
MHACVFVLINGPLKFSHQCVQRALARHGEDYQTPPRKMHLSHSTLVAIVNHYQLRWNDPQAIACRIPEWMGEDGGVDDFWVFALLRHNP